MTAPRVADGLSVTRRKARLLASYLRGRPVWCSWQITPRCGPHCAFCEHRAEGAVDEASLEAISSMAERLGRPGSLVVSFSGGEPFLRPELADIVAATARWHFPLVTTYGWRVTEERARAAWEAGLEAATVILDDADAVRADASAGIPGAHARAVAAVEAFLRTRTRASQQVQIKVRMQGDSVLVVEGVLGLARDLGAGVVVEPAFPVARGVASVGVGPRLQRLAEQNPALRTEAAVLGKFDEARAAGVGPCLAGRAFFNVDHKGRVSKCVECQEPTDHVGDLSLEEMGALMPRLREVQRHNACRACWSASRAEVERLHTVRGFLSAVPTLVRA